MAHFCLIINNANKAKAQATKTLWCDVQLPKQNWQTRKDVHLRGQQDTSLVDCNAGNENLTMGKGTEQTDKYADCAESDEMFPQTLLSGRTTIYNQVQKW